MNFTAIARRCHGPELTLDTVTTGGPSVEFFGTKGPPCNQSELVDDSTRWSVVAAILLDGPDPPIEIEREHKGAATNRAPKAEGSRSEYGGSSPRDGDTRTSDY